MNALFRKSRYGLFLKGTLCAFISIPFLVWGFYIVTVGKDYMDILIPFIGILISVSTGLYSMLHQRKLAELNEV